MNKTMKKYYRSEKERNGKLINNIKINKSRTINKLK